MIQLLLFFLAFSLIILIWGVLGHAIVPSDSIPDLMVGGFVLIIAIFQLAATPLMAFHAPFRYALTVFWSLSIVCVVVFAILITKYSDRFKKLPTQIPGSRLIFWLAVLAVLIQATSCSIFYFENPDDSFYVSTILTNMDSPAIYSFDPSTGDPSFPMMAQYRYESWELLQAVLAKSFSIAPAVLAHTALPYLLVIFSYLAYSVLAREILPTHRTASFLLALAIFYFISGYSDYSAGTFLLTRVWQGKSVLLHIAVPYLLATLLQWIRSDFSRRFLMKITAIMLFGFALNPIAVFLLPLILFPIAIVEFIKNFRRWKEILPLVFCIFPLVLYALAIRVGIQSSVINRFPIEEFSLRVTLQRFIGSGMGFFLIYILGFIAGWKKINYTARVVFVIVPILYLVTIWNPLFTNLLAKNVTSYPTYWRLFWLFPIGIGLAYLTVHLWQSYRSWVWIFVAAVFAVALINQTLVWKQLAMPENPLKIPAEHVELADQISSNYPGAFVIAPEEVGISLRQVTPDVRLFWSRQNYLQEFLDTGKKNNPFQQRLKFQAMYTFNDEMTEEQIQSAISQYQIEMIISPRTGHLVGKFSAYQPIYSTKNYTIFRTNH